MVKAIVRLAGAQVGLSALSSPKSVRSSNELLLIALRCLLLMLVNTPLRVVNRCCSESGGI